MPRTRSVRSSLQQRTSARPGAPSSTSIGRPCGVLSSGRWCWPPGLARPHAERLRQLPTRDPTWHRRAPWPRYPYRSPPRGVRCSAGSLRPGRTEPRSTCASIVGANIWSTRSSQREAPDRPPWTCPRHELQRRGYECRIAGKGQRGFGRWPCGDLNIEQPLELHVGRQLCQLREMIQNERWRG